MLCYINQKQTRTKAAASSSSWLLLPKQRSYATHDIMQRTERPRGEQREPARVPDQVRPGHEPPVVRCVRRVGHEPQDAAVAVAEDVEAGVLARGEGDAAGEVELDVAAGELRIGGEKARRE